MENSSIFTAVINNIDVCNLIIAFFAFIFSIFAFKRSSPLENGQFEVQIREMISNAKSKLLETSYRISQEDFKTKEEETQKEKRELLESIFEAALEELKNAYDEACAKYIDKKIDRKRFKNLYMSEIEGFVNDYKESYNIDTSKFIDTCKVYNKWFKKKNLKTKIKELFMNNKKIFKKIAFIIIILLSIIGIWILSEDWQNFLSVILVALVGCLIPFLFDETDSILKLLNYVTESIKPEKYKSTINLYNERLRNFASSFYFFLIQILVEDQKKILLEISSEDTLTTKTIANQLRLLLEKKPLKFVRIQDQNGNETFNDCSCGYFKNAEGELNDLFRILNILPPVLDFVSNRNEDFMNMQSDFYQVKDYLCHNAKSLACEAFTERLILDIINILEKE